MIKSSALLPHCLIHTFVSNIFARKMMSQPHVCYGSREIDSMRLHAASGAIMTLDFDRTQTEIRVLMSTFGALNENYKDVSLEELETQLEPYEHIFTDPRGTHELLPIAHVTSSTDGTCDHQNQPLQVHMLRLRNMDAPVILELMSETTKNDDDYSEITTKEYLLTTIIQDEEGKRFKLNYPYRLKSTGTHYSTGECMTYLRSDHYNMNWCAGHLDFEENTPGLSSLTHIHDLGQDRETDIAITLAHALNPKSSPEKKSLWVCTAL